jgi:hypothetical protein
MNFKECKIDEIESMEKKYASEVKERWGNTEAYAESAKKTATYDKAKWQKIQVMQNDIFQRLAKCIEKEPSHPDVQALIKERQDFITNNFYACSKDMLRELAHMNVTDVRFKKNIDKYADGLSVFIAKATDVYSST